MKLMENVVPIPISKLKEHEDNPNVMTEKQLTKLCEQISGYGFVEPLMVGPEEDGLHEIISGHHRARAAQHLGMTDLPCVVYADWDRKKRAAAMIRMNIVRGKLNPQKFMKLYDSFVHDMGEEMTNDLLGFADEGALKEIKKQIRKGLPKEIQSKIDKAEEGKEVGTVEDLTKTVTDIMADYGDTVPYNFLHFNHGGKKHIMQRCDDDLWKAVHLLYQGCEAEHVDPMMVMKILFDGWEDVVFRRKKPRKKDSIIDEKDGGDDES